MQLVKPQKTLKKIIYGTKSSKNKATESCCWAGLWHGKSKVGNVTQLVKSRMENEKETCLSRGWVRDRSLFIQKKALTSRVWVFLIWRQRGLIFVTERLWDKPLRRPHRVQKGVQNRGHRRSKCPGHGLQQLGVHSEPQEANNGSIFPIRLLISFESK